jgi:hypothetical protein
MLAGARAVAKKKQGPQRTTPVKIDTGLVRKARTIAEDKGIDLSEYLSETLRGPLEKDWMRVLKKIVEEREGE